MNEMPNRWAQQMCCCIEEVEHVVAGRHEEYLYQLAFHMKYNVIADEE